MLPLDEVDNHTKLRIPDKAEAVYSIFITPVVYQSANGFVSMTGKCYACVPILLAKKFGTRRPIILVAFRMERLWRRISVSSESRLHTPDSHVESPFRINAFRDGITA